MRQISIIGGGPAGLGVAFYSEENGLSYELYESNDILGGNCITYRENDFYFDSGAHRLHDKDKPTTELFIRLLKNDLKLINVPSQIFRDEKFIDFPISPYNLIRYLGFTNCVIEGFKILFRKRSKEFNFKSLAENKYGKKISKLFLLEYTEKLWGEKPENLSINIAGKRLKGLNIQTLIIEILFGKKRKTKHLDGCFYYPKYGIGTLFEKLEIQLDKGSIHKNSLVTKIKHNNQHILEIEINGTEKKKVKNLISSMPINKFLSILDPLPPKEVLAVNEKIKFRNIVLVIFLLDKNRVNGNGSMYFPSKRYPFTRVYEPKNRSKFMSPENKTSLVVEIPCWSNDKYWQMDRNKLVNTISVYLIEIGLFKYSELLGSNVKKIYNAYPVLDLNYQNNLNEIDRYISSFRNLFFCGRNGLFSYSHIHDQMINARELINGISQTLKSEIT